ncbi:MAG: MFS transporter [Synergistaceae bacterium]|nr:MFS transporter [Synergistaceae bacterium]
MTEDKKNKIDIFFRVVTLTLAGSFVYAMHAGVRNNYGIMLKPIIDHSGMSFASVSFILAVGQLIYGLVQPAFGILAARKGKVCVLVSGAVLTVAGMILMPLCRREAALMLCLGILLPAGSGAISYGIIMETITPKIPPRSVSHVSGVINASSGIGNTVMSPIINALLRVGGLRHGMLILSVPMALTLPISLLLARRRKRTMAEAVSQPHSAAKGSAMETLREAFRNRAYAYLMIGFLTCGFHMALITHHLPTHIQSFGFSSESVAYVFSIYGVTTILGSLSSGSMCNKFRMKNVLGFYYGLRPITLLLFLSIPKTLLTVSFFTALFGFSGAATVPPVVGIINKRFGAESISTLFGFVFFAHQIGGFFGAWLGGVCFEMTGSYTPIWLVGIVSSALASAVSFAIGRNEDAPMQKTRER